MRPLLSRTTDGRLEIAAAQQVVQKKKEKRGEIRRYDQVRRAVNVPSTARPLWRICEWDACAEQRRVGATAERDHAGGVADPNYFKREEAGRAPGVTHWRELVASVPPCACLPFGLWRSVPTVDLLQPACFPFPSRPFTTKALVTFEIPCASVYEIHIILTDESFLVFLLPARNPPFCNLCFHFFHRCFAEQPD